MQVFKLFYQIVWKYKINVFILMIIALAYAVVFVGNSSNQFDISGSNANVVVYDFDNTTASKGLTSYLGEKVEIVEMEEGQIEDALFYYYIDYALYIPKGYEETIENNEIIELESKSSSKSSRAWIVNSYVENYGNAMNSYYSSGYSIDESLENTLSDLNVEVKYEAKNVKGSSNVNRFFNFVFYSIFGTLFSAVALVMIQLNKVDISRRNVVSPVSNLSVNLQLLAASISFAIILWAMTVAFSFFYFADAMKETASYLYILNLFVLLFPLVSLIYLLVLNVRNKNALSGISNVVALGMSFLGGVFVPQSLLGSGVITIAKFVPSYWFINTNDQIIELTNLNDLSPLYNNMLILIAFGIFYVICAVVISGIRRRNIQ